MIESDDILRQFKTAEAEQAELVMLRAAVRELRAELSTDGETLMLFWCPSCQEQSPIDPWVLLAPVTTIEKCPACGVTWRVVTAFVEMK